VKQILAREGDTVHAGDVLLLLDDGEIRAAKAQAVAALAQARAGRSSLKVTSLPQASAALAQIRASLAESLSDRDRQRTAFVIVTHDTRIAERCARVVEVIDGKIHHDARTAGGAARMPVNDPEVRGRLAL
jgi:multidrug resistance efflux pump